jgi:hypothetical protein
VDNTLLRGLVDNTLLNGLVYNTLLRALVDNIFKTAPTFCEQRYDLMLTAWCVSKTKGKTPHSVPKLNYTTLVENGPKDFETVLHMQDGSQFSQHDNYSETFCLPPKTLN